MQAASADPPGLEQNCMISHCISGETVSEISMLLISALIIPFLHSVGYCSARILFQCASFNVQLTRGNLLTDYCDFD